MSHSKSHWKMQSGTDKDTESLMVLCQKKTRMLNLNGSIVGEGKFELFDDIFFFKRNLRRRLRLKAF